MDILLYMRPVKEAVVTTWHWTSVEPLTLVGGEGEGKRL